MMKLFKTSFFLILILSLTGCGYHLRGSGTGKLNVSSIYLDAQNIPLIELELRDQLAIRDVTISPSNQGVDRTLKLYNEQYTRRVLSVDESTGKVTEYELEYHISLEILAADGTSLAEPQEIFLIRAVTFDPNAALSKFDEEILVRDDMVRSAANSILLRIQVLK